MAEFWREPITNAKPQHVSGIPTIPGMSKVVWLMDAENAKWLLAAKGCVNCLSKFPCRPMKGTEQAFYGNEYVRPWAETRRLIRDERCPVCGFEVSYEMAKAFLVPDSWTDPAHPSVVLP